VCARQRIGADDVRVGDVLPDPHFSGLPGRVTRVTPTWYGASIAYEYDGHTCVSAVFNEDVELEPGQSIRVRGIVVERNG
jgi:hypothetical protein